MKKLYLLAFTAILALVAGLRASALTTNITWDVPGSVVIKVGSTTADPVALDPDATQYTATIDNTFGYVYVYPAEGYLMVRGDVVKADGSSATINATAYGGPKYLTINLSQFNGATVHAVLEKVVYDAEIEVNIINGRDKVSFNFPGTGRELSLNTGVNVVKFSTQHEPNLCITAPANGAEDYYVKKNGVELNWVNKAGILKIDGSNDGVSVANGDKFEVKYCNIPDVSGTATVTLAYADETAREALTMIFNISKFCTVPEREQFTVTTGDQVRFVFNTKDFDVWVNDAQIEASEDATTPYVVTVGDDITLNIRASERSYGTCLVTLYVANPEGVTLRVGSLDGPEADLGEPLGTVEHTFQSTNPPKSAVLTTYQVEANLKSPKVFVFSADGYWLQAAEIENGDPRGVATNAEPLYVLNPKVEKDTRLVVYLGLDKANVQSADVKLRDRNQAYALAEGYNEFMIDPEYSGTFSVSIYSESAGQQPVLSAFLNMAPVKTDDNEQLSTAIVKESVMHIWAGRNAPAKVKLSAEISPEAVDASVVADKIRNVANGEEISVFRTCEIAVTPAGAPYLLNGETPVYDGPTHIFPAATDYVVTIAAPSGIATVAPDKITENVYNIHGQLVRPAGSASPLPPGLYVTPTRKFLIP